MSVLVIVPILYRMSISRPRFDGIAPNEQSNLKATNMLAYIMDKLCQTGYKLLRNLYWRGRTRCTQVLSQVYIPLGITGPATSDNYALRLAWNLKTRSEALFNATYFISLFIHRIFFCVLITISSFLFVCKSAVVQLIGRSRTMMIPVTDAMWFPRPQCVHGTCVYICI